MRPPPREEGRIIILIQIFRDGLKAVLSRQRSRQRRDKAAMSLTEARQGRGRELEAEARQTKFEARPRRGDP